MTNRAETTKTTHTHTHTQHWYHSCGVITKWNGNNNQKRTSLLVSEVWMNAAVEFLQASLQSKNKNKTFKDTIFGTAHQEIMYNVSQKLLANRQTRSITWQTYSRSIFRNYQYKSSGNLIKFHVRVSHQPRHVFNKHVNDGCNETKEGHCCERCWNWLFGRKKKVLIKVIRRQAEKNLVVCNDIKERCFV